MTTRRRSLVRELGAALVAIEIVLLVVLGWFAFARIRGFHHEQRILELDRLGAMLARRYEDHLDGGAPAARGLAELVRSDGQVTGARITVIMPGGDVLADSRHDVAGMDNHADRPEVVAALARERGSAARFSRTLQLDMMYLARPVVVEGEIRAIIRTALPLDDVNRELAGLLRSITIAGLVCLALTGLVIVLISRRIGGTIAGLARSADRYASGDLAHRARPPRTRELAHLTTALNEMAVQLDAQINRLNLQRNEQEAILESMGSGMIALDLDQRIIRQNRAAQRMLGLDPSASRGRLIQEMAREPELHRVATDALNNAASTVEFAPNIAADTRIQVVGEPLRDADDRPVGALLVLNDVTDLRRLETLRTDFAANVSHELRTPITNLKGYVETLIDLGSENPEQSRHFLDVVRKNADRLAAIVEDLMALTRLEQPRSQERLDRVPTPVAALVHSAVGQFRGAAEARAITVTCTVDDDLEVAGHSQLLEQAIGNLLSNAINYSPERTRVTITGRRHGTGEAAIEVADEGPGIPREHLDRLFERFYRVDRARSRELGGTGLGLAIVKHVALIHGGRVEVESEVGTGSTFRIVIPVRAGNGANPS